jgi:hypothetical protein
MSQFFGPGEVIKFRKHAAISAPTCPVSHLFQFSEQLQLDILCHVEERRCQKS